jgi:cyclopropane fatty-acyl-phospholipid synthase-like methyltransferase
MIHRLFFELHYLFKKARWDTGISPPELIDFLDNHQPGHALDLGCGTGTNAITIHRYGWEVVGIDISSFAIRMARRKAKSIGAKIHFIQGDVAEFNGVDEAFDLILDIGCFHAIHPESKSKYAGNIRKHLQPNGTFLLYTWLQQEIEGDERLSPEEKLVDLFRGCCECVNILRSKDWESHRPSGWFTFKRVP